MSQSSEADDSEGAPGTRKKLSAKDLQICLSGDDDLDSAPEAFHGSHETPQDAVVITVDDSGPSDKTESVEESCCNGKSEQPEKTALSNSSIVVNTEADCESAQESDRKNLSCSPQVGAESEGGSVNHLAPDEAELLAKLEEANKRLEADSKSLHSISPQTQRRATVDMISTDSTRGHSRHGSLSSEISCLSASSTGSNPPIEEVPDDLWLTWKSLVDNWDSRTRRKSLNVKDLVRKGIPTHFRGTAWPMVCGAHTSEDRQKYSEYMRMTSACEKLIRRDIARTYPDHQYFKDKNGVGQETLFNVMKAYSLHDREVGYCQGSGFIVGLLLMQMPEEDAFAVFVKVMQELRLRELYKPNMAEIGLCMFQLEAMVQEHVPELYNHFQVHGLYISMFAAPWFLTLLTTSLPLFIACRVFDIFLLEGLEIIFRMGFAILQILSAELQTLDMEGMIKLLQKDLPSRLEGEAERLFATAFQVPYSTRKMKKLEKDYNALKSKEDQEQTEIRKLRTDNRLLKQRIDNLEAETAALADRLIQDQVKYAQQSEEIYSLRRAVSYTRRMSCEALPVGMMKMSPDADKDGLRSGFDEDVNCSTVEELQKTIADMVNEEIRAKAIIQDLRTRIQELEKASQQRSCESNIDVQNLQDQLIASKMREAEANLSTRELEQKVSDLERYWQKHLESMNSPEVKGKNPRSKLQEVLDELMSAKIREAGMTAELTDLKQKFMELETKNHICERQIKRLEGEGEKLKETVVEHETKENDLESQVKDLTRQILDAETKKKEEEIMLRIKEAEHSQVLAEMRQRIAELEIQNQELQTSAQLHERGVSGNQQDLENKIADLQEELQMMQLRMSQKMMASSILAGSLSIESDSDIDLDDIDASRLRLTDSMGPQLAGEVFGTSTPKNTASQGAEGSVNSPEADADLADFQKSFVRNARLSSGGMIDFDKTPTNDIHMFPELSIASSASADVPSDLDSSNDHLMSRQNKLGALLPNGSDGFETPMQEESLVQS